MLLNEYQRQASGTAIYPGRMSPHGLMYCALKMNGEAGELADHLYVAATVEGFLPRQIGLRPDRRELIVKEVGDVMWYLAAMADELETDLRFVFGGEPIVLHEGTGRLDLETLKLNGIVGQIAEQIGKAMRDDSYGMLNTAFTFDRRVKILSQMRLAMLSLLFICGELGISLQDAMEINIKKLAARQAKGTLSGSGDNR